MARDSNGFFGLEKRASYSFWVVISLEKKFGSKLGRLAKANTAPVAASNATTAPPGLSASACSATRCRSRSRVSTRSFPA